MESKSKFVGCFEVGDDSLDLNWLATTFVKSIHRASKNVELVKKVFLPGSGVGMPRFAGAVMCLFCYSFSKFIRLAIIISTEERDKVCIWV